MRRSKIVILGLIFVLAVGGGFLALMLSKEVKNGELIYGENLTEQEKAWISEIVPEGQKFSEDFTIDAKYSDTAPIAENTEILADILVPVTDFTSEKTGISGSEFSALDPASDATLISINELTPEKKLLAVDGEYYLDDLKNGAKYRIITIDKENEEISEIVAKLREKMPKFTGKAGTLTINQTGVTALTRKLQAKLNETGDGAYFAEKIKDFLAKTDLTHISNEVSFADNCRTDSATTTLCADPRMIETIKAIGTDIVELTGNHNNDWATAANLATIKTYKDAGLKIFGGGENEEKARKPLEIDQKGTKITWIGINNSTSTKANGQGAVGDKPGANIYDEETVKKQIATAKENGDFVIVDVQFFECYSYPTRGTEMPSCDAPIENQANFFRHLVDLGADLVVGTSAHQPQTYELYRGKPIYYGLGNLFFDQIAWPGTTRSLVLTHYFQNGKLIQTRISPTVYDASFQTRLMDQADAEDFLRRLLVASPKDK